MGKCRQNYLLQKIPPSSENFGFCQTKILSASSKLVCLVPTVVFCLFSQLTAKGVQFLQLLLRTGAAIFKQTLKYFQRREIPDSLTENPKASACDQFKQQLQPKELPNFYFTQGALCLPPELQGEINYLSNSSFSLGHVVWCYRIKLKCRGMLQSLHSRHCRSAQLPQKAYFSSTLCCKYRLLGLFSQPCSGLDS